MEKQKRTATNQINFRVTDEEMAVLKVNAERAGFRVPMYCKRLSLGVKVKPQIIGKELGQSMLPIIGYMGSNINQLAKKANEGGTVAAAELAEVKAEFDKLWDLVLYGKKPKQHKTAEEKLEQETGQTRLEESPETCPVCGSVAVRKHSNKHNQDFWICPNYSKEEKGHLFKWVE